MDYMRNKGKTLYLLYSCNMWKERDSMKPLMVTSSKYKLKYFVAKCIEEGRMRYGSAYGYKAQVKQWKEDFDKLSLYHLHDALEEGFIEIVVDGEEI